MLEDKELGLKISESKEEGFWLMAKKNIETELGALEKSTKLNKVILRAVEEEIKKEQDRIASGV